MRILYIDIDTLRPDHLGCYGYHRNTSPNIDRLAAEGVRFENCYVSDSPCLPSRAALYSGKCGIRNGANNHGGKHADYYINPRTRNFRVPDDSYIWQLRKLGYYTATVSPFGERHSSFWFYEGFREMYNTGKGGGERADEVVPLALDWLDRKGGDDDWYLHVNVWDPHTPYQVPEGEGNPFENEPPPAWMTDEVLKNNWNTYGPGNGQEPGGSYCSTEWTKRHPRMPENLETMEKYKQWIDGYDTGIWYADKHVGQICTKLEELGILDDTLIMISSDHGENQGELAVYGDHQTGDHITNRVPMIVRHPKGVGGKGRVDTGLHYQFDITATLIDLLGGDVPQSWDGISFAAAYKAEKEDGRDSLVVSNCAWSCQRSARWDDYIMIRTYQSGFKNYPDLMLFNVAEDPHELNDLSAEEPDLVNKGLAIIEGWATDELRRSPFPDPMWTILAEGGPLHANFKSSQFENYKQRLRDTGREQFTAELDARKARLEERLQ